MWWIILLFDDIDNRCDEVTLTTNLGHVCEIIVKQVPRTDVWVRTPRGGFRIVECPRYTRRIENTDHCKEKNFKVVYELVVTIKPPVLFTIPTKFGLWRPLGDTIRYVCSSGRMNGYGQCEVWDERRKKR